MKLCNRNFKVSENSLKMKIKIGSSHPCVYADDVVIIQGGEDELQRSIFQLPRIAEE